MSFLVYFLPIFLFILIFVGTGIYFSCLGMPNAFYQLSPLVAMIPAIALGWFLHKGKSKEKMSDFLNGICHQDIITMCLIFLLAGAFSEVTKQIGSVDATINFALSFIPSQFLLIGLFLVSAFIATSIGTSMGTIATIAPIGLALSQKIGVPPALCAATVVGGAMFGDNLSLISDTTIASVMSQKADMTKKFRLNAKIALVASLITMIVLSFKGNIKISMDIKPFHLILVSPYLCLIGLAFSGTNVFVSLVCSIAFAGAIGLLTKADFGILALSQAINKGFVSMNEIMLLSLMVAGLSGLTGKSFSKGLIQKISVLMDRKKIGPGWTQFFIAKLVMLFDILLANNTIAIIFTGDIAKELAKKQNIPSHYTAAWLDIFSCVCQGLIPYGAQILLVSTITKVSPLSVVPKVYYCYVLAFVSFGYILWVRPKKEA